jgi:group I intron endonuclease
MIYIGKALNFSRRKREHLTHLNNNRHHNAYLQNAWNKYKKDAFIFEILFERIQIQNLNQLEVKTINQAIEKKLAYNLAPGGQGGATLLCKTSEERSRITAKSKAHKEKLRLAHLGKKHSQETCRKISKANKGQKRKPLIQEHKDKIRAGNKWYTHSEETKIKISLAKKKYWLDKRNQNE